MVRWFRLLLIFISAFFRQKILVTDTSHLSFRVWPQEADKKYMNNASFWTITEMGQMDLLFRSGLFKLCRRNHWSPLVGSQKMVYKKPLKRFERFELKSKLIYWDDKWGYLKQTFLKKDQLIANSLIKVIFRSKDGNVPFSQILTSLGIEANLPLKPIIDPSEKVDEMLLESEGI
jgi:acyl-CoA thioesterase FadM